MENRVSTVDAEVQRFERGMIMRLRMPRSTASEQWVLLVEDNVSSQYWSFVMQVALLGSEPPIYRAWEHFPPIDCCWPDEEFGALWVAMRDLLGWAVKSKVSYSFPYESQSDNPCDLPRLIDSEGRQITLHPDRTWSVEPHHFPMPDAAKG